MVVGILVIGMTCGSWYCPMGTDIVRWVPTLAKKLVVQQLLRLVRVHVLHGVLEQYCRLDVGHILNSSVASTRQGEATNAGGVWKRLPACSCWYA